MRTHNLIGAAVAATIAFSGQVLGAAPGPGAPPPGTSPPGFPTAAPTADAAPKVAAAKVQALVGTWQASKLRPGPIPATGVVSFTPAYEARRTELERVDKAHERLDGNEPRCIPNGMPMMMFFGFQLAADAERITVITAGPRVRWIWLNRSKHTDDNLLFPTYSGESIGHWEGDTLIVDTVALMPTNEIIYGLSANDDTMHVVERWHLNSSKELEIVTTVEDAAALAKPWTYNATYARQKPNDDLTYCVSATDRDAGTEFNLTPPAGGYIPPGAKQ